MFDTIMYYLPIWLPTLVIGSTIQWLIVRSASLSALRKHDRERTQ